MSVHLFGADTIPEPERAQTIKEISLQHVVERALGVQWRVNTDAFDVNTSPPNKPFYSCVLSCQAFDLE